MRTRSRSLNLWILSSTLLLGAAAGASADDERRQPAPTPTPAPAPAPAVASRYRLVGWNDLGMHCVDGNDFSVFSILPPFNNVHAQLVDASGKLVKAPSGITVTYQAVADPDGSINRTSIGKTNFWQYVLTLYGGNPAPDVGLTGNAMPGAANTPRPMTFDAAKSQWVASGVPITPYPDGGSAKNYYPLMRLVAKSAAGATLATTDIVLPVSDEMACATCHSSTSGMARPSRGWVSNADPQKDYRLNILSLHDDRLRTNYAALLATKGFPSGMLISAQGGKPVLCASCHASNALPGTGVAGVSPLTRALHAKHATVVDPKNGNLQLDALNNRTACYNCHPGSVTKCLRGAMGNAVDASGNALMQCQSCHGTMSVVAASTRRGWLDEPGCEGCHSGTAMKNSGQIRFTSVFSNGGVNGPVRPAADARFAVNSATLYRMSSGHGGLQCEACHGSTHAEYPSSHRNDNLQNIALQGRAGTLAECSTCHSGTISTTNGGPHGMHPIGASWVSSHHDSLERTGAGVCRDCHGADYRGTVLSAALAPRSFSHDGRTVTFAKGTRIGCYSCHNGPNP